MDEWVVEDVRRESKRHLEAMVKEFGDGGCDLGDIE